MFSLKHTLSLACLISTAACTASTSSVSTVTAENNLSAPAQIEKVIQQSAEEALIPGTAVAYIKNNKLQWISTYGIANDWSSVQEETLFNVASLTKPMFSILTLQLVQDEKLTLDESLAKYWVDPDIKEDPRHTKLTARLALSHQTGFANWRRDKPLSFMFRPGERHEYSGEGFDYLRRAVEKRTNASMPELMEHYITSPLAMKNTYFGWQPDKDANIATRYDELAQEIEHKSFYKESYSAACCTLTTINDYSKFITWVSKGAGLSSQLLKQIQSPQAQHDNPMEHFGLGWRLITLPETTYLMHDGREPGVRAFTTVSSDTGEGLIILTNSSNGELLYRPVIQATLVQQQDYLAQTDKDTWMYLTSVPKEIQPRMIQFIAQSPSFVSKALFAANETVFSQPDTSLSEQEILVLKKQAADYISNYAIKVVNQESDGQPFISIMEKLLHSGDSSVSPNNKLANNMNLKEWISLLKATVDGAH